MKSISIMFSGQGAQSPGMGKDLYDVSPAAKAVFDRANDILHRDIAGLCFNGSVEDLTACANCQPAIFTMSQAAMAALKERVGDFLPAATAGLSLGEYSALVAANVLSFDDALRLVAKRGELMDKACRDTQGGMAAVLGGDPDKIAEVCAACGIDVANYNCPGQIVISGESAKVADAVAKLTEQEFRVVTLQVAGAYHSRVMAPAAEAFAEALAACSFSKPACPIAQNFVGDFVETPAAISENLRQQICGSVRWEACLRKLMAKGELLVECGPGNVLCGFVKRTDKTYKACPVNSVGTLDAAVQALA